MTANLHGSEFIELNTRKIDGQLIIVMKRSD